MDTADSINKMLQHKLDEIQKQTIEEEDSDNSDNSDDSEVEEDKVDEEGKKVLGKRTPLVFILSYLNKSITVILVNAIYI